MAVQLVSCGVLPPGLVQDCLQHDHLPPITKTIQVRRTRHAGHCWKSRDELISDVLLWTPTYGRAKAGRPARTYIQQLCEDTGCIVQKTCQKRWTIWKSGERGSGISVLPARHDYYYCCYYYIIIEPLSLFSYVSKIYEREKENDVSVSDFKFRRFILNTQILILSNSTAFGQRWIFSTSILY